MNLMLAQLQTAYTRFTETGGFTPNQIYQATGLHPTFLQYVATGSLNEQRIRLDQVVELWEFLAEQGLLVSFTQLPYSINEWQLRPDALPAQITSPPLVSEKRPVSEKQIKAERAIEVELAKGEQRLAILQAKVDLEIEKTRSKIELHEARAKARAARANPAPAEALGPAEARKARIGRPKRSPEQLIAAELRKAQTIDCERDIGPQNMHPVSWAAFKRIELKLIRRAEWGDDITVARGVIAGRGLNFLGPHSPGYKEGWEDCRNERPPMWTNGPVNDVAWLYSYSKGFIAAHIEYYD